MVVVMSMALSVAVGVTMGMAVIMMCVIVMVVSVMVVSVMIVTMGAGGIMNNTIVFVALAPDGDGKLACSLSASQHLACHKSARRRHAGC